MDTGKYAVKSKLKLVPSGLYFLFEIDEDLFAEELVKRPEDCQEALKSGSGWTRRTST